LINYLPPHLGLKYVDHFPNQRWFLQSYYAPWWHNLCYVCISNDVEYLEKRGVTKILSKRLYCHLSSFQCNQKTLHIISLHRHFKMWNVFSHVNCSKFMHKRNINFTCEIKFYIIMNFCFHTWKSEFHIWNAHFRLRNVPFPHKIRHVK
jgi:hypothetical protein